MRKIFIWSLMVVGAVTFLSSGRYLGWEKTANDAIGAKFIGIFLFPIGIALFGSSLSAMKKELMISKITMVVIIIFVALTWFMVEQNFIALPFI